MLVSLLFAFHARNPRLVAFNIDPAVSVFILTLIFAEIFSLDALRDLFVITKWALHLTAFFWFNFCFLFVFAIFIALTKMSSVELALRICS